MPCCRLAIHLAHQLLKLKCSAAVLLVMYNWLNTFYYEMNSALPCPSLVGIHDAFNYYKETEKQ